MLKWILNLVVAFLAFRLFRAVAQPRRPSPGPKPPPRGLDPNQEVSASWKEVQERERDGTS